MSQEHHWWNFTPEIKEIWPELLLASIMASTVKLSFLFLTTELLFLYVDYRLCLSLGAINIYQDQLYILELRKIYLTTLMAVKKPLQSQRKGRKEAKAWQSIKRGIFLSLSYWLLAFSLFLAPNLHFFLVPLLNAYFSVLMPFVGYWQHGYQCSLMQLKEPAN